MPNCSFCGVKEDKATPVCQSCGALRYPVENQDSSSTISRQDKLKLSAAIAAVIVTPGSLIVLALMSVSHFIYKK